MNISEFKSSFNNLARANLFKVNMTAPGGTGLDERLFQFRCKSTDTPGSTLGEIQIPYMGRKIKIAGDRLYADWNTVVIADEDWGIYNSLYEWFEQVNSTVGNTTTQGDNDYKVDAEIVMLGRDGSEKQKWRLVGLWPKEIQQMNVNWETNDTALEFTVTWAFDWFEKIA